MLIEFRVANHRSIRDEQALSMKASARLRTGCQDDPIPRQIAGYSDPLLPVAAIYGANASGKSNVLSALAFMRDAVTFSQRTWAPEEPIPRDPFAWGPLRYEPSLYEVEFLHWGKRFRYGFAATDQMIVEEWLDAWPEGHKQNWFHRTGGTFKLGEGMGGDANKFIRDATRANALFLSTAVQLQHERLLPVYQWFRGMDYVFNSAPRNMRTRGVQLFREQSIATLIESQTSSSPQRTLFPDSDIELFTRFQNLMRSADLGILDFRAKREDSHERRTALPGIQLKHLAGEDDAWLPLEEESRGTRTLFNMALPILRAIDSGSVLLIDELESNLHPKIADAIVRQFNDPSSNPNNAQIIFTTHDSNLLGTMAGDPPVRRDEVWLTEKNPQGGTELYPLTDFKPRKAENIERGYLQGRYGAIPFLDDFFSIAPGH